jgi:hypothetical protein
MVSMTTRAAESVFGLSEPRQWGTHSQSPTTSAPGGPVAPVAEKAQSVGEVQRVNTELNEIASTIADLQNRLADANSRLKSAERAETTEAEIGRLFVEAQRFSDEWLSKIELKIHEVLDEAEAKARQILLEATEEAQRIRGEAQQAAFASTGTVRELQSAIAGFTTVNSELLKELGTLNGMLAPDDRHGAVSSDPSSPVELDSWNRAGPREH